MKKDIYHGSPQIIAHPIFGYGKTENDYGVGFYCTEIEDMAKEWSTGEDHDGFANHYQIETDGLSVLNLNDANITILHWLAVLLGNRFFPITSQLAKDAREYLLANFAIDYSTYDIMYGYRADDSYFSFAQDFLNGTISLEKLTEAMHLGKYGMQYVLKSRKAFDQLEFVEAIPAARDPWFMRKTERDETANREYFDSRKKRKIGQLYITQILDETIGPNDERILRALR